MTRVKTVLRRLLQTPPASPGPAPRPPAAERSPPATGAPTRHPLIGIVTPVRNRRDWTLGFVRMACRQDYPLFRLYVVDSHSTDGTPEAVRALGLSPVVVIDAPDSAYWTEATNLGVARALADGCAYVLTLNDDAIFSDDYLTSLVASAEPAGSLVTGSVISYVDDPGRIWGVGAYNDWSNGSFLQLGWSNSWDDVIDSLPTDDTGLIPTPCLCGNGTLVHRSVYETLGLYDARRAPHYHADSEFTMRVARAGIACRVAPRARLYNRFSDVADGSFAARNQRLFSLRSANYAPAVLSILDGHCPDPLKTVALVRYFTQRLSGQGWRRWSTLLRCARFLALPASERVASKALFFPPLDPAMADLEDLAILLDLPDRDFVAMLFAWLLRRAGSDAEHDGRLEALRAGRPRKSLILDLIGSDAFADDRGARRSFLTRLVDQGRQKALDLEAAELPSHERWILRRALVDKRPPTRAEARAHQAELLSAPVPLPTERRAAQAEQAAAAVRVIVHMSVDVLCMAVLDPKAATGVHRYIVNVMAELARNEAVDLRVFHSPELADSFATLRRSGGALAGLTPAPEGPASAGVVFYPYFSYGRMDERFRGLPVAMTICDVFPLTNPEWFSQVAVSNFRRQLHDLVAADHVICISRATETLMRASFPQLRATSSVAHLGVSSARDRLSLMRLFRRNALRAHTVKRYVLCVGTIEPRKNLKTVIAAMGRLTRAGADDLQMLVVGQEGWSITSQELNALAGEAASRIHFLGRVADDDLWGLYDKAVCTVFPSLAEGFGFPIVESFSCGAPVITSDGSSMSEIAETGAILVDPLDPDAIAAAIEAIATDPALRKRLSAQALERAALFTWRACADRHVEAFVALAPPGP